MNPSLAMKAARLPVHQIDGSSWWVHGDSDTYFVRKIREQYHCSCDAARFGSKTCSHIVAVRDNPEMRKMSEPQTQLANTTTYQPLSPVVPRSIDDVQKIAQFFAQSGYFKEARDVSQAFAKILAGQELGLGPMAAMSQIHIVEGKMALDATLIGANIKKSGRYDYRVRRSTNDVCSIEFFEKGESVGTSEFTREEATRAGLINKNVWKSYPKDMMRSRAMTRGARTYCPDVFNGSIYTPEELERIDDAPQNMVKVAEVNASPTPEKILEEEQKQKEDQKQKEAKKQKELAPEKSLEETEKRKLLFHIYSAHDIPRDAKDPSAHKWLIEQVSKSLGVPAPEKWGDFKLNDLRIYVQTQATEAQVNEPCEACHSYGTHVDGCPEDPNGTFGAPELEQAE